MTVQNSRLSGKCAIDTANSKIKIVGAFSSVTDYTSNVKIQIEVNNPLRNENLQSFYLTTYDDAA